MFRKYFFPKWISLFLISCFFAWSATAQTDPEYCIPAYTVACISGIEIDYVGLEGETQDINSPSGCSDNNYADYTDERAATVLPGNTYTLTVATNYVLTDFVEIKAWIDYDSDGEFSSSELIAATNGSGLEVGGSDFEFTVPDDIGAGEYRMRVRLVYAFAEFDACSEELHGETEDYTIEVLQADECDGTAEAGTPVEDSLEVCTNMAFSLEVEGASDAADGMTRIWQQRLQGEEDWNDIAGAFSPIYEVSEGILEPSEFRYKVSCGSETDISNIITVDLIYGAECYCDPLYLYDCDYANGTRMTLVRLLGETVLLNNETGCEENTYGDYSDLPAPDLIAGSNYVLTVSSDHHIPEDVQVKGWIDFNQNGSYEESELIFSTEGTGMPEGTKNFNIVVPQEVNPNIYRMRIRLVSLEGLDDFDSCSLQSFGEAEDYSIEIIQLEACEGEVFAGNPIEDYIFICANTNFVLSVTDSTDPAENLERKWQYATPGTDDWTDVENAVSASYFVENGIDEDRDYRYYVYCENSDESDVSEIIEVRMKPVSDCFCIPSNTEDDTHFISRVKTTGAVQNIDNNTGFSENGYGDYSETHIIGALPGQEIEFTIYSQTAGGYYYGMWVDVNHNSEFDEDEYILLGDSSYYNPFVPHFTVPGDLAPGDYRIRIRNAFVGGIPEACGNNSNGETEDYTLRVLETPACTPLTQIDAGQITADSAQIIWEDEANDNGWQLVYGLFGFDPDTADPIEIETTAHQLENLDAGTHYQVYVRAHCDSEDSFSPYSAVDFTTQCEAVDLPYSVDFEDVTPPDFPICTTIENAGFGNDWEVVSSGNFDFESHTLVYKNNPNHDANAWFYTRGLNLEADVYYELTYKYGSNSPDYTEKLKVALSSYAQASEMENVLADHPQIIGPDAFNHTTYFMVDEPGVYYVGFNAYSESGQRQLYVDDIEIKLGPVCPAPLNIELEYITDVSAMLTWESIVTENQYVVVYGEQGFDPENESETNRIELAEGVREVILTDLQPSTVYDVYVLSVCSDTEESIPDNPVVIQTTPSAPGNTLICDAFELTINADCETPYTNHYAFSEENETYGSCLNIFHGSNTVWFKFMAPNNGEVTITTEFSATNFGVEVAVYEAPQDCEYMMTLGEEVGCYSSSDSGFVSINNLTPGNYYYIQVSGFNDISGSFCIGVFSEMGVENADFSDFVFYPNPVDKFLEISAAKTLDRVRITDINGREVLNLVPGNNEVKLDLSALSSGIYMMQVQMENSSKTYKLIKK